MNLKQTITGIFVATENRSQYESAYRQIRSLTTSDLELFEALWPEAIKSQRLDRHVLLSALTLYHLNLKCPITLHEALLQIRDDWEISIEEVPWYLVNQFSKAEISSAINELNLADDVKGKAILYWIANKKNSFK